MSLYDTELERMVVASMLDAPDETLETVAGYVHGGDLHDPTCGALYSAALAMYAKGQPRTVVTVADTAQVARETARSLWGENILFRTPSSVAPHAQRLGALASRRRLCITLRELSERGQEPDVELDELLGAAQDAISNSAPSAPLEPAVDGLDMVDAEYEYRWLVPHLLERRDRLVITGPEGFGKSVLLRQMGVQLASGLHPFSQVTVPRSHVLIVDLENSEPQISRGLRTLRASAGECWERGWLFVVSRQQGMDLRSNVDVRWLDALMAHHRPDVLIIGPLYKAFRAKPRESKSDETAAEEVAAGLDRLRVRHDCAVFLEAHSPHGEGGDRARFRPIGASLFLRWPEMGFGLKPMGGGKAELIEWRGLRDRARRWPKYLSAGHVWPWEALEEAVA